MGGPGELDLLFSLAEFAEARRVIETGVAYGWSSLALLLSLNSRQGRLVSTDLSYPGLDNDAYVGCAVPSSLRRDWTILHDADRLAVPQAIKLAAPIDLCHYDSDKSYRGRSWSYRQLWQALKPNGIFISDDIGDNMGFADFSAELGLEPVIVQSGPKYVGILLKKS
jgi:predicted O-methyltransferase YrrM